jgi:hypothetical protein
MDNPDIIKLEDGWEKIMTYLARVEVIVEDFRVCATGARKNEIDNNLYMSAFTAVYNIVSLSNFDEMFRRMCNYVQTYFTRVTVPRLRDAIGNGDYLLVLNQEWKTYVVFHKWVRAIFRYLDRQTGRGKDMPSVAHAILRKFEATAISTALSTDLGNQKMARARADITLVYIRSKYPSMKLEINTTRAHANCTDFGDLSLSLNTLADENAPGWTRDVTGHMAMATFPTSLKKIVATLPTIPRPQLPYMGRVSRLILNELLTDKDFWQAEGICQHVKYRVMVEAEIMTLDATQYRTYQRLLLATLSSRGADSKNPLVSLDLCLCDDVCDLVRNNLNTLPAVWMPTGPFMWHEIALLKKRKSSAQQL